MNRIKLFLVIVAVAAGIVTVSVSMALGSRNTATSPQAVPAAAAALQQAFVNVFKHVSPSVVQIKTDQGLGSGVVFDSRGDIVTNFHVVTGANSFTVTTSTGRQLQAKLVGSFQPDDLAVIRVSGGNLRPATFADSSKLRVGDIAMAIGNPLGLSSSVTEGIVSALGRQEPEGNGVVLANAIQTSAPINPGNSGGALVDLHARVIGIPTLGAADPQMGGAASGIGFAIPSNTVKNIARQIVATGRVTNSQRAFLGVNVGDTGNGVYIGAVTAGGPAAKAGVKVGDVITAIDGKPTPSSDALGTVLAGLKPGQTVTVTYQTQSGAKHSAKVTLGEFPGGSG